MTIRWSAVASGLAFVLSALSLWDSHGQSLPLRADDQPVAGVPAVDAAAKADSPAETTLGQFLTISSVIDDATYQRITTAANQLEQKAALKNTTAVLVLQIEPANSLFHQVQGLARFLSSGKLPHVRVVAWVPKDLTGLHAMLLLACNEVVAEPDCSIGDLGKSRALDADEQLFVDQLTEKRINRLVNPAVGRSLWDRQLDLWQAVIRGQDPEQQVLTPAELEAFRDRGVAIEKTQRIREGGQLPVWKAENARGVGVLVARTANSRAEVAELYRLSRDAMREATATADASQIQLIRVPPRLQPMEEAFMLRQINRAVEARATMIVLLFDSTDSEWNSALNLALAVHDLTASNIRTVAFVEHVALGPQALVAAACDQVYLTPTSRWGGAMFAEDDLRGLRDSIRTISDQKRRPSAIIESMFLPNTVVNEATQVADGKRWFVTADELKLNPQVWQAGPAIEETTTGRPAVFLGERAVTVKLAESVVNDFTEVQNLLGVDPRFPLQPLEATWVDALVFSLNQRGMVILLLVVGVASLYLEIHLMTGVLWLVSAICFVLFFWSHFLGGTAGWLEVSLFLLGVALLSIELLVIPGFGFTGVTGILLIFASLVMALQSISGMGLMFDLTTTAYNTGYVAGSIVMVMIFGLAFSRFLPSIPFFNELVLTAPPADRLVNALPKDTDQSRDRQAWIGLRGTALTMLRPAGKASIGGASIDVVSEGNFIRPQAAIEVVDIDGTRIVVREVDGATG